MTLEAAERETVVNTSDDHETVTIWTAQRRYLTQLRKHPKVVEVDSGSYGSTEWGQFEVPRDQWSPVTGVKRAGRKLSAEEKQKLADRLRSAREH